MNKTMLIVVKGAGDLASGIALRLFHAGFSLVMTEIRLPTAVRRTVCFSEAVYNGRAQVEEVTAVLVRTTDEMSACIAQKEIALFVDEKAEIVSRIKPAAVVDAIIAKRNTGTSITDAKTVVGVGPGFTAGHDCHAVVETSRGHTLGRVIYEGGAIPNTGIPGNIGGYTTERLLRAHADGIFITRKRIGDVVHRGEVIAETVPENGADGAAPVPIVAAIDGILRGILPSGLSVHQGMKAGDIDPRCEKNHCFTVSDKALAVAGGVLEALLHFHGTLSS
jgi:xanthine dehydrogenase accessory factor